MSHSLFIGANLTNDSQLHIILCIRRLETRSKEVDYVLEASTYKQYCNMKMINTIQSVPRHFASKVKEVLSFTKRRRRGNDDGMALRSKLWFYLKELEAEMNNWVRGEKVYLNISNFVQISPVMRHVL